MKKNIFILLTAVGVSVVLLGIAAFFNYGSLKTKLTSINGTVTPGGHQPSSNTLLNVSDIQADPKAYKGTVKITGVMAGTSPKDARLFAIIDTAEAQACKTTGCANFYLPIRYNGQFPKQWDKVNVTGSFRADGNEFEANKVEVVQHLNL